MWPLEGGHWAPPTVAHSRREQEDGRMQTTKRVLWTASATWMLGALCSAQQWMLEISGSVGGDPAEWEVVNDIEVDASGGLVLIGDRRTQVTDSEPAVMRMGLDTQDAELRQYTTPDGIVARFSDAHLEPNGTLVGCGSSSGVGIRAWIASVDIDSNTIHWECTPAAEGSRLLGITRVADGYVAVGTVLPGGSWNTYVVKVDFDGEVVWQRDLAHPETWSEGYAVVPAPDGGVFVSGVAGDLAFLMHLDPDGEVQRCVRYETDWMQSQTYLVPAQDGGLFIASTQFHTGEDDHRTWVARVAPGGAVIWQYRYETLGGILGSVRSTPDGGCLLVGTRGLFTDAQPSAMQLDADGLVEWYRHYDLQVDHVVDARGVALPDGGAVIAAKVTWPQEQRHVRLVRVGPTGEIESGCLGIATLVPVARTATNVPYVHVPLTVAGVPEAFETLHTTPQHMALETILHCGDPCGPPVPYCLTSPNSVGPGATISWLGSTSLATNGFALTASALPPTTPGLFFYGSAATELPFADGTLCVAAPTYRLGTVTSFPTGDAYLGLDLSDMPAVAGPLVPGSRWFFQLWYRDLPGGPAGSNLTNGLDVTYCP